MGTVDGGAAGAASALAGNGTRVRIYFGERERSRGRSQAADRWTRTRCGRRPQSAARPAGPVPAVSRRCP